MKSRPIVTPEINNAFTHGEIIEWNFNPSVTPAKGKYCFRFSLTFADGTIEQRQIGGFKKRSECIKERERVITQLHNHEYAAFPRAIVKEYYDFWLHIVMVKKRKITYATYMAYRNVIYNYIVPYMGKSRLCCINRGMLVRFLKTIKSPSVAEQALGVLWSSFKYAKGKNLISINPALGLGKEKKRLIGADDTRKSPRPTLTLQQTLKLILCCKDQVPFILLPLLFSLTMGLRISETIALKYGDIDFNKNEVRIERQLGRVIEEDVSASEEGMLTKKELKPKSRAGIRLVPIPQFVLDEVIVEREKYEQKRGNVAGFQDYGYIWCHDDGRPFERSVYGKYFKKLLKLCEFPDMHWHDLRRTYATILSQNDLSLKAIASAMGHSKEIFTADVYTNPNQLIADGLSAIVPFIHEVLPKPQADIVSIGSLALDVVSA